MRVTFLAHHQCCPDGITLARLQPGDVVEVNESLATRLIDRGIAEPTQQPLTVIVGDGSGHALPAVDEQAGRSRTELEDLADDLGLNPAVYAGDEELAAAINTARDGGGPGETAAQLEKHPRALLNQLAAERGIGNPERLPNKQAVIDAITSAR